MRESTEETAGRARGAAQGSRRVEGRKWDGRKGEERRTSEEGLWRVRCYRASLLIWQPQSPLTELSACHLSARCSFAAHSRAQRGAGPPLSRKAFVGNNICICQHRFYSPLGFYYLSGKSLKGFSCRPPPSTPPPPLGCTLWNALGKTMTVGKIFCNGNWLSWLFKKWTGRSIL